MFKNLIIYKLNTPTGKIEVDNQFYFRKCGANEEQSIGWVNPITHEANNAFEVSGDLVFGCLQIESKILPKDVIEKQLAEDIKLVEANGGKVSKKEMRDDVIFKLLPKAFTQISHINGYIDNKEGYIYIDTASSNKAEIWLSYMRKTLGSLDALPVVTNWPANNIMARWIAGSIEQNEVININNECVISGIEDTGTIRAKDIDITSDEVLAHISNGGKVTKLAITYDDKLSMVLCDDMSLKRLKFIDIEFEGDDVFASEWLIMHDVFSKLIPLLITEFGGLYD